jgi:hypothetical protein
MALAFAKEPEVEPLTAVAEQARVSRNRSYAGVADTDTGPASGARRHQVLARLQSRIIFFTTSYSATPCWIAAGSSALKSSSTCRRTRPRRCPPSFRLNPRAVILDVRPPRPLHQPGETGPGQNRVTGGVFRPCAD